jgi:hypothetical protein
MGGGRAAEPFEPILIQKRGESRLAERGLPDDSEERRRGLVRIALQWRQNSGVLRRVAIERVGTGSEPELDEASPLRRGQYEMGGLVQNYVSFGRAIQCRSVPIEAARDPLRVDRYAEAPRERECSKTMPLCLGSGGTIG